MALLDGILHAYVTVMDFSTSPYVLLALGFLGAYLGGKLVEVIPVTRRIIERRAARD